ncbi:MAG: hypothetical protein LBM66_02610 [Bifidobacteriaceae bacterium]|jgi:hypothetical protein|nr:hypothetical protein [Bifidobacteriaceae bacterium]
MPDDKPRIMTSIHGSLEFDRMIRAAISVLRQSTNKESDLAALDDIAAGKRPLRDLARIETFDKMAKEAFSEWNSRRDQMSGQERTQAHEADVAAAQGMGLIPAWSTPPDVTLLGDTEIQESDRFDS